MTTRLSPQPPEGRRGCPHSRIEFCPLYLASHECAGGCDDGRLGEGGCAVSRGMDYGQALARLSRERPALVREAAERESEAMRTEQRQRNARNLGLH
jgi:hypothetical protein